MLEGKTSDFDVAAQPHFLPLMKLPASVPAVSGD